MSPARHPDAPHVTGVTQSERTLRHTSRLDKDHADVSSKGLAHYVGSRLGMAGDLAILAAGGIADSDGMIPSPSMGASRRLPPSSLSQSSLSEEFDSANL